MNIQISLVHNFISNCQFLFFGPNWPKKVFPVKNWKSEHHHWTPHIQISLGTEFPLKLTISIFLTRFAQKGFFWSKTEKIDITYYLHNVYIKISLVQIFSWNWQFWFFGPNLHKKVFPVETRKSEHQTELPKFSELPYFVVVGEGVAGGGEKRHYVLSSYFFPFLKVSSVNFVVQSMTFQAKLPSHCF